MTPTEKQLRAQVLANPGDDAPRLVYADWLVERGDPRGEFIIRQVRDPDLSETIATDEQRRAWFGHPKVAATFRRGFAEQIWIGEASQLDELGAILGGHPIDHLGLTRVSRGEGIDKLVASPHLGAIRKLTFMTGTLSAAMLERLLRAKKLALEELWIADDFDLRGAKVIGRWPNLKRLTIDSFNLGLPLALAIVRGPVLATVRSLGLGKMLDRVKDVSAMVAGLVANKKVKLDALEIHWSKLDGKPMCQLLERFAGLERLSLRDASITDAKAKVLAGRPELATLKRLGLSDNKIGDLGARMLASTKFLDRIERLDLTKNSIGAAAQAALRARFGDRVLL